MRTYVFGQYFVLVKNIVRQNNVSSGVAIESWFIHTNFFLRFSVLAQIRKCVSLEA